MATSKAAETPTATYGNRKPVSAEVLRKIAEIRITNHGLPTESRRRAVHDAGLPSDRLGVLGTVLELTESLGDRIRSVRTYYKMTQTEFADLLKIKQGSVSRWESGLAEPTHDNLTLLAALTDTTHVGHFRYGFYARQDNKTEPVYEKPVTLAGVVDGWGLVDFLYKLVEDDKVFVARPREGLPYDDMVALEMDWRAGGFYPFFGPYVFFYRDGDGDEPEVSTKCLSILETGKKDRQSVFVLGLVITEAGENRYDIMYGAGTFGKNVRVLRQWPILSIRSGMGLYST